MYPETFVQGNYVEPFLLVCVATVLFPLLPTLSAPSRPAMCVVHIMFYGLKMQKLQGRKCAVLVRSRIQQTSRQTNITYCRICRKLKLLLVSTLPQCGYFPDEFSNSPHIFGLYKINSQFKLRFHILKTSMGKKSKKQRKRHRRSTWTSPTRL